MVHHVSRFVLYNTLEVYGSDSLSFVESMQSSFYALIFCILRFFFPKYTRVRKIDFLGKVLGCFRSVLVASWMLFLVALPRSVHLRMRNAVREPWPSFGLLLVLVVENIHSK